MTMTYYGYPKCGTCRKAKKWLETNGLEFKDINIAENPPTEEELRTMIGNSTLDIKKFFNVSGMKYRELNLKDKLPNMTDDEKIQLLSTDGMLIKRPIVTDGSKVTVGFNETQFEDVWKTK
ncbi:arsenate reductase family protein [Sporosarcina sp. FSL W8-0480]|uniref:arsenate reductase family protein n=1 Tax=Sporosarcina sp. FSL W8-0480 TaxID=2954701 RepID=UPI0030D730CB